MNIAELAKFRGGVSVDTISELSSASGVTIDGVLLKDGAVSAASGVSTNTISEYASGSGVTVDGVLLKDGRIFGNTSGVAPGAGEMGEYKETTGSATAMTNAVFNDGGNAGLALGVGVWDLQATCYFIPAATTRVNIYQVAIATTSGGTTTGSDNNRNTTAISGALVAPVTPAQKISTPLFRVVVASGTVTYYPKCYAEFDTSTITSNGYIFARRVG